MEIWDKNVERKPESAGGVQQNTLLIGRTLTSRYASARTRALLGHDIITEPKWQPPPPPPRLLWLECAGGEKRSEVSGSAGSFSVEPLGCRGEGGGGRIFLVECEFE